MLSKGNIACRVSIASFSVWLVGSVGCATMSSPWQGMVLRDQARPALPSERVASAVDTRPQREPDNLTSVAEFLARTSEYQLAGSPAVYVPKRPAIEARMPEPTPAPLVRSENEPASSAGSEEFRRELRSVVSANTNAAIEPPTRREPALALPIVKAVTVAYRATPVSTADAEPGSFARHNTANQPLAMRETKPEWTVDSVLERLEHQATRSGDLDGVWPLKFVQLAFHRDSDAAEMPASLPASARGILASLMRLVPAIRGLARDASTPGNEALVRLDDLRRILVDRSDPVVSKIALCRKVVTFGVYDEIGPSDFVAGRENQAIVYTEIRNLRAERSDDGRYVSRLGTRLEVLTAAGHSVWQHEEPEIVDESRDRRIDFFVAERIVLPSTLSAGDYVLKVMVQDKLSERMHEASTSFVITSAQRVTSRSGAQRTP